MRIAIYGGSFDPVHKGHLRVVEESLKELEIDKLIVVPTFISPFKAKTYVEPNTRMKWLEIALPKNDKIEICSFEINQKRPIPTIETVRHIANEFNPCKIYLIVGADHLKTLTKWDEYNELCNLCEWTIASRDNIPIPNNFTKLRVDYPAASTDVRELKKAELLPIELADEILSCY
ncbi:MAG: fused nicotinate-mononucleotide adenylyltransferase / ribosomal silencing factor [Pseudomonadota bacterium]|jgi:nicotinate-nucleotide adenylyltransferase